MPKRSAAAKAETREKLIHGAARAIRERGYSVGIAEVMDDLGLTHGGFYRHFESKDDLIIAAVTAALDEVGERLERIASEAPPAEARAAIITAYLSPEHVAHPEKWCAIAALAGELGRASTRVRKSLDAAMLRYAQRLAPYMHGSTDEERTADVMRLLSGMAGAIAMIRGFGDPKLRNFALQTLRESYLAS